MSNYNNEYWLHEQESKGVINWFDLSKSKKWYKAATKTNLADDFFSGLYYNDFGTAPELLQYITDYYQGLGYQVNNRKKAKRCGYLTSDCFGVVPYSGQWGAGWIVMTHLDNTTVCWNYIIVKGGSQYGSEKQSTNDYKSADTTEESSD